MWNWGVVGGVVVDVVVVVRGWIQCRICTSNLHCRWASRRDRLVDWDLRRGLKGL